MLKNLAILFLIGLLAGCSTPPLNTARSNFYAGHFEQADKNLTPLPENDKDQILFLMERGMIRQCLHKYEESSTDWRKAADLDELRETYSLSRGTASLLTNDRALPFRGKPFERTLLFTFLANNYLAQQNWDYAAICARNIIQQLEHLDGFPDISYSRYMAGLCMEMINDPGNAALQYRIASDLLPSLFINERTGQLIPETGSKTNKPAPGPRPAQNELVCFVAMGRIPPGNVSFMSREEGPAPFAEFYCNTNYLGRSYPLTNTKHLLLDTEERLALIQLAKDVSRIALKETIAETLEHQHEALGFLTRLVLFAFEMPDTRRWETLPLWLEVARLPCPADLASYTVIFKNASGKLTGVKTVMSPISRHGNVYISFCHDISE